MEHLLNQKVGETKPDELIYDASHEVDGKNVVVTVNGDKDGMLLRGQVIDYENNAYKIHEEGGDVSCIIAADTAYAAGETEVVAQVYISGSFRYSRCIADPELTDDDVEDFRSLGIYLK